MVGLSQVQALGLLVVYCVVYVLPLHVSPATRASPSRSRDDPGAIRARVRAVSVSTAVCSLATFVVLMRLQPPPRPPYSSAGAADALRRMGYWPPGILDAASALILTVLLFAAPLFERLVLNGDWQAWHRLQPLWTIWASWPAWRNLVAGPITEECLFRSAAVPLLLLAGANMKSTIFLSPLVFGLAHVHHFYEFRITQPQVPLTAAIVRSVFQFSYTYLFGIYATFLFLRTGSLLAVIIVHAFCNAMGLPRFWGYVEPYWLSDEELDTRPARVSLKVWSGIYYVLLVGGMFAWLQGLYPLTESLMALANV